jgi:hypothetical protein
MLTAAVMLKPSVPTLLLCSPPYGGHTRAQPLVVCCEALRHTLDEFSGSDIPSRELLLRHRQLPEEEQMQDKNLKFCMDQLRSLRNRDGLEPELRSELERAMEELRRLWRKQNPCRKDVYRAVRLVAEALLTTFKK